jgi:hypothetical protein
VQWALRVEDQRVDRRSRVAAALGELPVARYAAPCGVELERREGGSAADRTDDVRELERPDLEQLASTTSEASRA